LSRGISAELLFDYLALNNGLTVSRPISDHGYDRIVDYNGRLNRIQIKSCTVREGKTYLVSTTGNGRRRYNKEFDFYAIYLKQDCMWVIIPDSEVNAKSIRITGKYHKYIDNWDQLK